MDKPNIYSKLLAVIDEIKTVGKNGENTHQNYNYAMEKDLLDEVKPLLLKHGLIIHPTVLEQRRDGALATVKMEFRIVLAETKEELKSIFYGEGQDKGDKATYKAYTGAVKYFLMKTFLIPTGDDPEQDEQGLNNSLYSSRNKKTENDRINEGIQAIYDEVRAKKLMRSEYEAILSAEIGNANIDDLELPQITDLYKLFANNTSGALKETAKAHLEAAK